MKKLGDLMKELGFNPESPVSAQEAFIKHLIREAYGVDVETPTERRDRAPLKPKSKVSEPTGSQKEKQMSFDIRDLVPADNLFGQPRKRTGTS
jgi:hypothetical protein